MNPPIGKLSAPSPADLADLAALLRDAVEGGASVGFLLPLTEAETNFYWADVNSEVARGTTVLLVARDAGRIVGSVQLALVQKSNARHRCELQKLLVLRSHRGRSLGTALLAAAEEAAHAHRRTLIVLDTSASGHALGLYARCGYVRAGIIPCYAGDPNGSLIDTVLYFKELSPA